MIMRPTKESIVGTVTKRPMSLTRRQGLLNMGQPLKSFRDARLTYPQYQPGQSSTALRALGELRKPRQGERR